MLAAVALGSNLPSRFGEPSANLVEALRRLGDLGEVLRVSSFFETDPVGLLDQPRFTNAAALLRTALGPLPLLRGLLAIEAAMGRLRAADQPHGGPRPIDLDLLFYAGEDGSALVLADPELTLPHPALHKRRFVLAPLAEIAPDLLHPLLDQTVLQLLQALPTEGC